MIIKIALNSRRQFNNWGLLKYSMLSAKRELRCEQDSNLRGDTPLDFESNALTTRPSQRLVKLFLTLILTDVSLKWNQTRIALDVLSVHKHVRFYHENSQKRWKYVIDGWKS